MKLIITIPELIPGNNSAGGFKREHWTVYKKRRDRYQLHIASQTRERLTGVLRVKLVRYSSRLMADYDNLVSCGKSVLDALVREKVIPDDSMDAIGRPDYQQVKISRKEKARYEIIIEQ